MLGVLKRRFDCNHPQDAQAQAAFLQIHLDHTSMNLGVDRIELRDLGFRNRRINLGDMDQSLNPFLNLNEDTEVRDVHDGSRHLRADRVLLIQILPRIPDELLDPQREAFLRNVDVQNLDLDLLTLLSQLGGFAKPLGPRDV